MNTEPSTTPRYFLAKSEPGAYSIDDLEKEGITPWDGVHNYQAINFIKQWQVGDYVFIYHSMGQNSIVGLAQVVTAPKKDENDPRNISWVADIKFIRKYPKEQQVTLKQVKAEEQFAEFKLVRNSRLSVMDCPQNFVDWMTSKLPVT